VESVVSKHVPAVWGMAARYPRTPDVDRSDPLAYAALVSCHVTDRGDRYGWARGSGSAGDRARPREAA
jgi:hypothetical protein